VFHWIRIRHFKWIRKFNNFFSIFVGHFCVLLYPDTDLRIRIRNTTLIWSGYGRWEAVPGAALWEAGAPAAQHQPTEWGLPLSQCQGRTKRSCSWSGAMGSGSSSCSTPTCWVRTTSQPMPRYDKEKQFLERRYG
jgi:hypothetical protein